MLRFLFNCLELNELFYANDWFSISSVQLSTIVTIEELGLPVLKKIMTIPYPHRAFGRVCLFIFPDWLNLYFIDFFTDYLPCGCSLKFGTCMIMLVSTPVLAWTQPLVNLPVIFGNKAISHSILQHCCSPSVRTIVPRRRPTKQHRYANPSNLRVWAWHLTLKQAGGPDPMTAVLNSFIKQCTTSLDDLAGQELYTIFGIGDDIRGLLATLSRIDAIISHDPSPHSIYILPYPTLPVTHEDLYEVIFK